jgi:hypothetical protein
MMWRGVLGAEESAAVHERYHIAAPGRWVWGGILANFTPGHREAWVDYADDERLAGGARGRLLGERTA